MMADRNGPRALALTDAGLRALRVKTASVPVPLLNLPWRPDRKDRREGHHDDR